MTILEILIALRARWKIALIIFITVVATVAAFTYTRAPKYTATAAVLLDVRTRDPIAGSSVLNGSQSSGYMATEVNVLQSERVSRRAIEALRIDQDATLRRQWQESTEGRGDFKSWISGLMLRNLDVLPARESNVLTVNYTAADPDFAALVANAWVNAYIGTTLDLRVDPAKQYNSFFDARSKQLRDELERAQSKLSAYQQQRGLIITDERLDVENQRLVELTSQLVTLQSVVNESTSRLQQATGNNSDRMQEVINNSLLMGFTADLTRKEGQLKELTTRFGDNYPQVVELRASIAELRTRINDETQRVKTSVSVSNDINQDRIRKLNLSVEQQRVKLLELKTQRDEAAVLQRDIESAKRIYDEMLTRASLTSVESQTTQTNVAVLANATPPTSPSSPRVMLNMAVAILAGGLLAIGIALGRETMDKRLRTNADVARALRQPLLGVLPVASKKRLPSRKNPTRARLTARTAPALPGGGTSPYEAP